MIKSTRCPGKQNRRACKWRTKVLSPLVHSRVPGSQDRALTRVEPFDLPRPRLNGQRRLARVRYFNDDVQFTDRVRRQIQCDLRRIRRHHSGTGYFGRGTTHGFAFGRGDGKIRAGGSSGKLRVANTTGDEVKRVATGDSEGDGRDEILAGREFVIVATADGQLRSISTTRNQYKYLR